MGFCSYGAAAEQIAVPTNRLTKIPEGLALDKAAGLSVTYGTSLHALKQRAEMKPGETLLVLGASGGVGLAAVEIGKAMGARVIAGASSEEKLAFARRYGAAETINTASDDMRARLKEIAPKGVDVVYDPVGGALTEAALRSLAWKGRLLVIGFASGEIPRPAAQYSPAQGLRHPRRLLGRIHRPRAGSASREHGPIDGLGEVRRPERSCPRHISAGGLPEGVRGDRQAPGAWQNPAQARRGCGLKPVEIRVAAHNMSARDEAPRTNRRGRLWTKRTSSPVEIRRLWPSDKEAFRHHLLSLDPRSRHMRFGGGMSDEFLVRYAENCFGKGDLALRGVCRRQAGRRGRTALQSGDLERAGAIRAPHPCRGGVLGRPGYRRRGIGEKLFKRILRAATNHGVETIEIVCLPENVGMQNLAKKFQAQFALSRQNSLTGRLTARPPTALSLFREASSDALDFGAALFDAHWRAVAEAREKGA